MKLLYLLLLPALCQCTQGTSQPAKERVGGPCEVCDAIYESPVPFDKLDNMVWLPDWNETGRKIAINGVVYKADGKTPAPGVVIYIYHTDQHGVYPVKGDEKGWAKRNGYLRGWMRTNEKGEYKFFTLRPAPYPGRTTPAHIHIIIKEPDLNAYWIDEFLFDDDPLLTAAERKKQEQRGGSGIVKLSPAGSMVKFRRDIYLGRNIPHYPYGAQ